MYIKDRWIYLSSILLENFPSTKNIAIQIPNKEE